MGAWGEGPFDNDDAADFVADLADGSADDAPHAIAAVFAQVLGPGYVEAPEMCRALAGAAVVAVGIDAALPAPASLPGTWLAALPAPGAALVSAARAVVARALDPADNEWHELWDEADLLDPAREALAPYAAVLDNSPTG